ncbi:MAG: TetR/AcrR family transcriptional regulator [Atopobiaceae bacterium]|jgi:AcrR family transcriptional regulator|nr:TetR/AcrR family transcriptional regulator [Atopobiaceae bacterium]MCH4119151.1 TetR/AcrR family transcriptional regulator [Atopobiaceae bacterium]MCI1318783.1 TetR/AcrR family transcriptional regulator [Atopobiaceae bacterium]MCI1388590.1 TetR/AcrR family transcriptional regulator [Atopobiaceae bacterium]MCI1432089.1 TetR/AcrR family transcriptional regulator [Atopobiaceae bacterium]
MTFREDPRVTKTKAAIEVAFIRLLHEQPFDKITVQQVCHEALVNKGTFYHHYHDKYDLAQKLIEHRLEALSDDVCAWIDQQETTDASTCSQHVMSSMIASLYGEVNDLYLLGSLDIEGVDVKGGVREIVRDVLRAYPPEGLAPKDIDTIAWVTTQLLIGFEEYMAHTDDPVNPYDYARLAGKASELYLSWIPSYSFEAGLRFWQTKQA